MIFIIKYESDCTTLFDTLEDNGNVTAVDAISINNILEGDFPIFDIETESAGVANERKAGEFGGTFSFLQSETSANAEGLNEFFRGGTRDYRYIILIQAGATIFHGTFNNSDLNFDFTYNENKYEVKFIARDLIEEWAKYLDTLNSYFEITSGYFSYEGYIRSFHLKDFNVNFVGGTAGSLSNRVGETVAFDGRKYYSMLRTIDWHGVTRLESFKGLARGLGFTYDLSVNTSLESLSINPSQWYPRSFMQVNIDWISEADTANALTITQTKKHLERLTPLSKRYLFIGYRNIISTAFPEFDETDFTAVRGILFDGENVIAESDSGDNFNPVYAYYPFFYFPPGDVDSPDGNYVLGNQFAFFDRRYPYPEKPPTFNIEDVLFVDLDKYSYTDSGGTELWSAGVIAYSRLFTTSNGFSPIQRFVVQQYKRYLQKAGKKVKSLEIPVASDTDVKNYKYLNITDDQEQAFYYVSKITGYSSREKTISLESTQV